MRKLVTVSVILAMLGCKDKDPNENIIFFQVKQYVQQQLEDIHKTPYYIYKIETVNGQRDSLPLPVDSIDKYAQGFIDADINDPETKKHYTESIFHDQTTKSFSLSYATPNKEQEVQSINVLYKEDGETVKRIFIRRYMHRKDSAILEQLSWRPDENFEINRVINLPGRPEQTWHTLVVWNKKPEAY